MATYTVKLLAKQPVAQGTMAFHLERPAGFEFRAGPGFVTPRSPPLRPAAMRAARS